ncbi:MAG: hypothetical protein AB7F28_04415 [Candidatus Margulisiibacteriota bacterium]
MHHKWLSVPEVTPSVSTMASLDKTFARASAYFLRTCFKTLQEHLKKQEPVPAEAIVETLDWAIEHKKPLNTYRERLLATAINRCDIKKEKRWALYVKQIRKLPWQEAAAGTIALVYHFCDKLGTLHPKPDEVLLLEIELLCYLNPQDIPNILKILDDNSQLINTANNGFFLNVSKAIVLGAAALTAKDFKLTLIWDPLVPRLEPEALEVLKMKVPPKKTRLVQDIQRIIELKIPIQTEGELKTCLEKFSKLKKPATNNELNKIALALETLPNLKDTNLALAYKIVYKFQDSAQEGTFKVLCALVTRPEYASTRDDTFKGLIHQLLVVSFSLLTTAFNQDNEETFLWVLDQLSLSLRQLQSPVETERQNNPSRGVFMLSRLLIEFHPQLQPCAQEAVLETLLLLPQIFPSRNKDTIEPHLRIFFLKQLQIFQDRTTSTQDLSETLGYSNYRDGFNTLIAYLRCSKESMDIAMGHTMIPRICVRTQYTQLDIALLKRGYDLGAQNEATYSTTFGSFVRFAQVLNGVALIEHQSPSEAEATIQATAALLYSIGTKELCPDLVRMAPTVSEFIKQSLSQMIQLPPRKAFALGLRIQQGCKAFQAKYFPEKCQTELLLLDETIAKHKEWVLAANAPPAAAESESPTAQTSQAGQSH